MGYSPRGGKESDTTELLKQKQRRHLQWPLAAARRPGLRPAPGARTPQPEPGHSPRHTGRGGPRLLGLSPRLFLLEAAGS